ncbi:MAG: His-Xaa-Ser system radical SAM maturase HxsB [Alphaproteobacteria bacterium]
MTLFSLRPRAMRDGSVLCTSDAGRFFAAPADFLERVGVDELTAEDNAFLQQQGLMYDDEAELEYHAHRYAFAQRFAQAAELDYLILVPTLRCNLSCSYCQVSRANVDRSGFDWTDDTLEAVYGILDGLTAPSVKIEFQGGEPTLRPDLIQKVIERCSAVRDAEYVVCTNLSRIDEEVLSIFDREDVYISTSLDGDFATHQRNRTRSGEVTREFHENLDFVVERYGSAKVSALPTIDPANPPKPKELINSFMSRGLNSIYLRPINYQGFARKRHKDAREQDADWRRYYEAFIRELISRNWTDQSRVVDETYFTLCLNRIFRAGFDRHVDLRNPNPVGVDYVVIDYDGKVYPTDEARMLTRSHVIDLAIGDVRNGWDTPERQMLNTHATNLLDPACSRCAYQPYCGRDVIDDLSRYGRIDLPRTETAFCKRHMHLFDFAFELLYSDDEPTQYSLRKWLRIPGGRTQLGVRHP